MKSLAAFFGGSGGSDERGRRSQADRSRLPAALLLCAGFVAAGARTIEPQIPGSAPVVTREDSIPGVASTDASRLRLVVSLRDRVLLVLDGRDTVFQAPVGVASGLTLAYGDERWEFRTPRGDWRVLDKIVDPVWIPPDWHYVETASDHGLRVSRLPPTGVTLSTGARLEIRNDVVGIVFPGDAFAELPVDEHVVFDGRLFIPPRGTANRQVRGVLGRFALVLGRGYLIHGTSDEASIGQASTHGCIRVRDDDLFWLYRNVPVGAVVTIR